MLLLTSDKRQRENSLRVLVVILIVVSAISCNKSSQDFFPAPVIKNPQANSMYFPGEKIRVKAEVRDNADFSHLELYLAETFVLETEHWSIDTLIDLPSSDVGKRSLRLIACDRQGNCSESSLEIEVLSFEGESMQLEAFIQEEPEGWFLSDWTPVSDEGFGDNYALYASSGGATAITRKGFEHSLPFLLESMSSSGSAGRKGPTSIRSFSLRERNGILRVNTMEEAPFFTWTPPGSTD